ncbi:NADPH dehydrogenase NamA [Metabacillus litoralis]|uniref:NADPH dehydrogenase NamA n=1 Tax=Metabacillus litoralis TaxID=152268 RepID=UPI001B92292F|nr:NADPH dehydrogenase NamA [Metabacillus litoralis]MCM3161626.1 NADPH dehydrogenase NamA [Metabacillus litoralis]MCM3412552.1 NADPH dehydrogenase NamA [Metabacillus litoralis]UHA58007.1 NADPH dehydrogenase NamA [Metabacillus litoralis]
MRTKLFQPYQIKDVTIKNRIVMSPMCMYSSTGQQGFVEDFHMTHYISRAVGQVGLIMIEATAVTPQGRISSQDLGIWSDDHLPQLKKLVSGIKEYGSTTAIQLAHAGRKATVDGEIFAPSAIPFDDHSKTPTAMTKEDIASTVQAFKDGARRAKEAGFDIIEIHGAHGYLINEFLSPLSNKREDEYGGSPENRYRLLSEVIDSVKEVWSGPLFVRISASDYHEEGLDVSDYVEFAKKMKEQGVDLIDVSSGAVVTAKINVFPGYQVRFAEKIKEEAKIATGAVGLITTGLQAEEILQNNRADLIFIARELLRDPYFPRTAAAQLKETLDPPKQYDRGW